MFHDTEPDMHAGMLKDYCLELLSGHSESTIVTHMRTLHTVPQYRGVSVRELAINGNNGSATNSDDVKGARGKMFQKNPKVKAALLKGGENIGGAAGSMAAKALGTPALARPAAKITSQIGRWLMGHVSKVMGFGPYSYKGGSHNASSVRVNSLANMNGAVEGLMNATFMGEVCDYIGAKDQVTALRNHALTQGAFVVISLPLNPGYTQYWPRLASQAQNYDIYQVTGWAFQFEPAYGSTVINSGTSGPLGVVCFAVERNVGLPAPTTLEAMSRMEGFYQTRLDSQVTWFMECNPETWAQKYWYVRNEVTGATTSVNAGELDCATLYVGIQCGSSVAVNELMGYLYAVSHVCVSRNKLSSKIRGYYHARKTDYANATPFGTTDAFTPVATGVLSNVTITNGNKLLMTGVPNGTLVCIRIRWSGTTTAALAYPTPTVTGTSPNYTLTSANIQANGSSYSETSPPAGTTSLTAQITLTYTVSCALNQVPGFTFGSATLPSTVQGMEIFIDTVTLDPVLGTSA